MFVVKSTVNATVTTRNSRRTEDVPALKAARRRWLIQAKRALIALTAIPCAIKANAWHALRMMQISLLCLSSRAAWGKRWHGRGYTIRAVRDGMAAEVPNAP